LFISGLIVIVIIFIYPKISKRKSLDDLRSSDGRISVVVMPFLNTTKDRIWNEIQSNLISYLSNYEELKIRHKESISSLLENKGVTDYAIIEPKLAGAISQKLDANVFIYGNISKTGSVVRINSQLVNSKTKEVFKSFQIDCRLKRDSILKIIDSMSMLVKNYLVKSKTEKEVSPDLKTYKNTNSLLAYQYFIEAEDARERHDYKKSIYLYSRAVAADSNFIPAIIFLSMRYLNLGMNKEAKEWCLVAYKKKEGANKNDRIMIDWYYATLFETPVEEIRYLRQYQEADDQVPVSYWQTGNAYLKLFQYDKAIPEYEKP
jgi:TolB-like protein